MQLHRAHAGGNALSASFCSISIQQVSTPVASHTCACRDCGGGMLWGCPGCSSSMPGPGQAAQAAAARQRHVATGGQHCEAACHRRAPAPCLQARSLLMCKGALWSNTPLPLVQAESKNGLSEVPPALPPAKPTELALTQTTTASSAGSATLPPATCLRVPDTQRQDGLSEVSTAARAAGRPCAPQATAHLRCPGLVTPVRPCPVLAGCLPLLHRLHPPFQGPRPAALPPPGRELAERGGGALLLCLLHKRGRQPGGAGPRRLWHGK